ncbi:DUF4330 domain-containing protein [uncultured Tyzzerella sp.]|uniref:DUF4330 domain-containing protein n=1 Tax=uncultured Tyzzerella sp. TaxID=2321398 RepID=UPI002942FF3E|nr:DUF4330 domain-containing protein [uncultured Tyzzerella sp.]
MSKIVDEKGKLFGIVNVVDLLVAIVIIGVIAIVGIRLTSSSRNAEGQSPLDGKKEIYVTLYGNSIVPEAIDTLKPGDKLVANNVFTDAEIVSIDMEPAAYITTNYEGEAILAQHPIWKDITVVIKDTVNASSPILKAGNQEVRVNYNFILKTQQFEANCKVRNIEIRDMADATTVE